MEKPFRRGREQAWDRILAKDPFFVSSLLHFIIKFFTFFAWFQTIKIFLVLLLHYYCYYYFHYDHYHHHCDFKKTGLEFIKSLTWQNFLPLNCCFKFQLKLRFTRYALQQKTPSSRQKHPVYKRDTSNLCNSLSELCTLTQ